MLTKDKLADVFTDVMGEWQARYWLIIRRIIEESPKVSSDLVVSVLLAHEVEPRDEDDSDAATVCLCDGVARSWPKYRLHLAEELIRVLPCPPTEDEVAEAGCRRIHASRWEKEAIAHVCDECTAYARAVAELGNPIRLSVRAQALRDAADRWYSDESSGHWEHHPTVSDDGPVLCRTSDEGRAWLMGMADEEYR